MRHSEDVFRQRDHKWQRLTGIMLTVFSIVTQHVSIRIGILFGWGLYEVTRVIHPDRTMNVCSQFTDNPPGCSGDILLTTARVNQMKN